MDFQILLSNLTNPTLLFFLLGVIAAWVKSDLAIPTSTSRFLSLYLLFAIGFKGGQQLAHEPFSVEILTALVLGIVLSAVVPVYTFFILKRKLTVYDAGAVAAAYGSVSAVTFVAASSYLEFQQQQFGGHMVAVMALMESPAIIVGLILLQRYDKEGAVNAKVGEIVRHALTNGSVLMVLGSLLIGLVADAKQAEGIKPFTTDIFKGFLAIFLLEMGMVTARRFDSFRKYGRFVSAFAVVMPIVNGSAVAVASWWLVTGVGNRFMFAILAASASYIAVPAAMKLASPKSDPGLYVPMAIGVTFPVNITIGFPIYYLLIDTF